MATWDDPYSDDENQDEANSAKGLRAHLKKLEKENAELRTLNEKLAKDTRQHTIAQALTAKGFSAKLARLVPIDVESTEEAIGKWLEDNAELFPPPKPAEGDGSTPQEGAGSDGTQGGSEGGEDAAQMGRISAAVNTAQTPTKQADLMAVLRDKSLTHEKLMELVHAAGGGAGVG